VQSDRQVSLAACESIIQANSDINLIFGANAECALGAYAATQSTNRNDIYVISVDTDNEVMDAIAAGTNLVATVAQDPYTMGYQAMMNCAKYLKGEAVEDIAIPHEIVTKIMSLKSSHATKPIWQKLNKYQDYILTKQGIASQNSQLAIPCCKIGEQHLDE